MKQSEDCRQGEEGDLGCWRVVESEGRGGWNPRQLMHSNKRGLLPMARIQVRGRCQQQGVRMGE